MGTEKSVMTVQFINSSISLIRMIFPITSIGNVTADEEVYMWNFTMTAITRPLKSNHVFASLE